MTEIVPEEERDTTFSRLFLQPENKVCFDCNASNPKWASVNNAVFLCFQCAGKHRTFGVQTSFVRSCGLDKWNRKQLKQMELGGNKAAKAYFEKHDLVQAGQHNYTLPLAVKYRSELAKKAEATLQSMSPLPAEVVEVKAVEEAKDDEFFEVPTKIQSMSLSKKASAVASSQPVGTKKEQRQQLKVKAKKLDIDFDNLGNDGEAEEVEVKEVKPAPLAIIPKPKSEPTVNRDSKFKKMKAISSTDYMKETNGHSTDTKGRLAQFANAKGISSDDYYGVPKKKNGRSNENGVLDKAKEVGFAFFESAKDKMAGLKEYASGWIEALSKDDDS